MNTFNKNASQAELEEIVCCAGMNTEPKKMSNMDWLDWTAIIIGIAMGLLEIACG